MAKHAKPSVYKQRIAYMREAAESMGLEVWQMSDAVFVRRLCQGRRCQVLLKAAKEADAKPVWQR